MTRSHYLSAAVADHVDTAGTRPSARRAAARWAALIPTLDAYGSPAAMAAFGRSAAPAGQDRLLTDLLSLPAGDEWAELTVLAVLAPRIAWSVLLWARAGTPAEVVADREADLTVEVWAAVRRLMADPTVPPPPRPGLAIVDRARQRVRNTVAVDRRRHIRHDHPDRADRPVHGDGRPGVVLLSTAIANAGGNLGLVSARALWLTRVAGYSTDETAALLDTTPASVRALRSRAATALGRAA